ncbi:MAG: DNA topoisomerase [Bacillota bacterium]
MPARSAGPAKSARTVRPDRAAGSKPLIIAEKPSAARAIAEALGGFSRQNGYLESDRYLLSWALGHLVEQKSPEEYSPRWKRWALEALPILPEAFGLKVVGKTRAQFEVLACLARTAPELINACDAGREGELIFRYICQAAGVERPARRLWVSSLTREAIRQAFADLRPQEDYNRLYQSALCRSQGDWLVGMNATRAFTVRWGDLLSVGRVQTPTLALVVRREREIEAFVPETYWEVVALFALDGRRTYQGKWVGPDGQTRLSREAAEAVAARVQDRTAQVESAEEKTVTERPPQLYDLTSLQREANRRYGLTAAATLKAAQSLYEDKLITYPRTDSRHLTRDLVRTLPGVLQAVGAQAAYQSLANGADAGRVHPGNRRVVDDSRVTDHHAILPTREMPRDLGGPQAKVYDLVVRRFLAQFYPDAHYLESEVVTRVDSGDAPAEGAGAAQSTSTALPGGAPAGPDRFRSRGRRPLEQGWRVVEPEPASRKRDRGGDEDEPQALPPLQTGDSGQVKEAEALERTTQPPRRYTEATLLSAMEFAGKELDDEALRQAMKGHGLGTPATRAAIIERLKDVGYMRLEKKSLVPTPKGRHLVDLAEAAGVQVLLSPELTGDWERRIADIQAGGYEPDRFMQEIRDLTVQVVDRVRQAPGSAGMGAASAGQLAAAASEAAVIGGGRDVTAAAQVSASASAASEAAEGQAQPVAGRCPRCGREVRRDSRGWTCGTEGCVRVPRYLCGKIIDTALAGSLLARGRTPLITGFKSPRTGKSFSSYLVLAEDGVRFEFPPDRPRRSRRTAGRKSGGQSS